MFLCIALFKYSHWHKEKVPDQAKKVKKKQKTKSQYYVELKRDLIENFEYDSEKYVAKE